MSDPLLSIRKLTKRFGGYTAVSNVTLDIYPGERIGLIGPNGSGKTTLMNCISGSLFVTEGSLLFNAQEVSGLAAHQRTRLGISRTFQIPRPFRSMTVLDNLMVPLEYVAYRGSVNAHRARTDALSILDDMGLADKANVLSGAMTQVELRKLELARALAARPQLLICDESMAGLSSVEIAEVLEILGRLNQKGIAIIMIEHIMQAVMSFSQRVYCLDAGELVCQGTPAEVVADPHVQRAYLGT